MGDFGTFLEHLKKGDSGGVTMSFRPDFLERPDDACKWRPIHWACSYGHVDIAKFLIEHNCDTESQTDGGWRPIHYVCTSGSVEIVNLLITNRCDFQCKTNTGSTPLDLANQYKRRACADVLTKAVKMAQIFDYAKRNECQKLKGLKTADVLIKEEPGTGLSFLEVALGANAAEVLKYFLD